MKLLLQLLLFSNNGIYIAFNMCQVLFWAFPGTSAGKEPTC